MYEDVSAIFEKAWSCNELKNVLDAQAPNEKQSKNLKRIMAITVTIENKEVQIEESALKLPDGYALITPNTAPPQGFLKQEAVDAIVGQRVISAKQKAVSEFIEDQTKHEVILSRYGVAIKDGKAVGVADANIDELKKDITLKVRSEIEEAYKPAKSENKLLRDRVIMSEIQTSAIKAGVKQDLLELVTKSFKEDFAIDKNGNVLVKDAEGFKVDASGNFVTAENYFLEKRKSDSYKSLFDATAQRGAGHGNANSGTANLSSVKAKADLKDTVSKTKFISEFGYQAYIDLK